MLLSDKTVFRLRLMLRVLGQKITISDNRLKNKACSRNDLINDSFQVVLNV